jgi:hypothetical protein
MTRWQWLARGATFSGAILLMSWLLCDTTQAQTGQLEYPRPCQSSCVPNARNFGYFRPSWRQWPGEVRMDEVNSMAVGKEVLPTPEGHKEFSPPAAVPLQPYQQPRPQSPLRPRVQPLQPQLPSQGAVTIPSPQGELPPERPTILPPEGTLLPPTPPEEQKAEPKAESKSSEPFIREGELPGLPDEEPSPAKPKGTKPASPAMNKSSDMGPASQGAGKQVAEKLFGTVPQPKELPKSAAASAAKRYTIGSGTVLLASATESKQDALRPGVGRADRIGTTTSGLSGRIEPAAYAMAESPARPGAAVQNAVPSVALNGYCPVELTRSGRWVPGDLRWTVVHQGWIFRLSGAEQRRQFLADPNRFAPVNYGNDVVVSVNENRSVRGRATFCATYNDRLYMFSSAATQAEFNKHPERYATVK